MQRFAVAICLLVALLVTPGVVQAAQPDFIAIHVDDIHCSSCGKRLAGHLYTVPGVLEVKINVKEKLAFVVPQKSKTPSPRGLWTATENAEMKPTKLVGRMGTFTSKPDF